ncbi:Caspase-2 [Manis pentadactyla]|nr:Caspase-2 [Manis pentadactyla]
MKVSEDLSQKVLVKLNGGDQIGRRVDGIDGEERTGAGKEELAGKRLPLTRDRVPSGGGGGGGAAPADSLHHLKPANGGLQKVLLVLVPGASHSE